ncbi:MAG: hypothetical protein ACKV19_03235 [Verrucomicrobiales bacterium]
MPPYRPPLRTRFGIFPVLLATLCLPIGLRADPYEVWLVDQSNSVANYGGRLHIYDGSDLEGKAASSARPNDVVDLGAETADLCRDLTGANPVRPHMLFFNSDHSHAVLAFVASGHVVVFDASNRRPLFVARSSPGSGGARQAHAAVPSPDDAGILVCNQNGKLLEWIDTDYDSGLFVHRHDKTVNLAALQNAQLPDNAPICAAIESSGRFGFVTLRGGGVALVDVQAVPMQVVLYDRTVFAPVGCGTQQIGDWMWIDAGGGLASKLDGFNVYRIPLASLWIPQPIPPSPASVQWLFSDPSENRDAHSIQPTKHGRYAWVFDRTGNVAEIFETENGQRVNTVPLSRFAGEDPTPDLSDISPSGNRIFVSLRGPNPLSGDPHASTGSTPGLGIIQVTQAGRSGFLKEIIRITNPDAGGVERADGHGIRVRRK